MKAIVVEQIGGFAIKEIPLRTLKEGEALVKVSIAGLCRTDLKIIRHGHRDLILPRVPGEEVVGIVVDQKGGDRSMLNKRVYVYPGTSCHNCEACKRGAENLCSSMSIMGFHRDGGFADYVIAPIESLILISDDLSDEEAVFAEPLSCCLNALELAQIRTDERVGIWGAGPAGILLFRASVALGAVAQGIEPDENRRSLIKGIAHSPEGMSYDVAIVAVGDPNAYNDALRCLKPRGRLIVFSGLLPEVSVLGVDFNRLHYYEQSITGAYGCSMRHSLQALQMIQTKTITVSDLITHRISLWELDEALKLVEQRKCLKIQLYPNL